MTAVRKLTRQLDRVMGSWSFREGDQSSCSSEFNQVFGSQHTQILMWNWSTDDSEGCTCGKLATAVHRCVSLCGISLRRAPHSAPSPLLWAVSPISQCSFSCYRLQHCNMATSDFGVVQPDGKLLPSHTQVTRLVTRRPWRVKQWTNMDGIWKWMRF